MSELRHKEKEKRHSEDGARQDATKSSGDKEKRQGEQRKERKREWSRLGEQVEVWRGREPERATWESS